MKNALSVGILSVCLVAVAVSGQAAEIHGTVSANSKPVPKGVAVKLDCGPASASTATQNYASSRFLFSAPRPSTAARNCSATG